MYFKLSGGDIPKDRSVAYFYTELLSHVLPFNALSIAMRASQTNKSIGINIAYCKGYDSDNKYKQQCSTNRNTFPYHVLVAGEPQEETIEEYDQYNIQEHRKDTEYALGACFPKHERTYSYESTEGSVIIEFDKKPALSDPREIIQESAELYGHIWQANEQLKERQKLAHVVSAFPKLDLSQSDRLTATKFLEYMAEALFDILDAEQCIFFEICNEANTSTLRIAARCGRGQSNVGVIESTNCTQKKSRII